MAYPQVCSIAGTDSGGGAGIFADIKTFQERDVFGTAVVVAVTAQNTLGVQGVYPVPEVGVLEQLKSVFSDFSLSAIKTGMLMNESYISLIADFLKDYPSIPLIVDPVMIAKGGAPLMLESALDAMITKMIPIATLITPNIPEAETILQRSITTEEEMMNAAVEIQKLGCKNVLVKGGHALNPEFARDFLLTENGESLWLEGKRIHTKDTHGTGCTYSACITAEIAKGQSIQDAVLISKAYISAAIEDALYIGHGHGPTNHSAYRKRTTK